MHSLAWILSGEDPRKKPDMLKGTLLITGGAGFLGRGIIRRVTQESWPCRLVVYSRDAQKHEVIRKRYPEVRCVLGDVLDTYRLSTVMSLCDRVVHAAALKYLPLCEEHPSEAIRINLDGTRSVIEAAGRSGIGQIVLISTDKAASPTSVYGMTKLLSERLIQEGACGTAVRYGNVIGSTGSVWPLWRAQAARDGRLSVTDPDMRRFFLSLDDAVDLVIRAFDLRPGSVLIPELSSIRIGDLADYLTEHWHLPEAPLVTGVRPGEKHEEVLVSESERDRIVPAGDGLWALLPPGTRVQHPGSIPSFSSATSRTMASEEFELAARSSEDV